MTKNLRIRQTLWSLNLRTPKIAIRTKRLQLSNIRFSRPERLKVRASVPSLPTGRCHTLPYICHSASVVSTHILLFVHEYWDSSLLPLMFSLSTARYQKLVPTKSTTINWWTIRTTPNWLKFTKMSVILTTIPTLHFIIWRAREKKPARLLTSWVLGKDRPSVFPPSLSHQNLLQRTRLDSSVHLNASWTRMVIPCLRSRRVMFRFTWASWTLNTRTVKCLFQTDIESISFSRAMTWKSWSLLISLPSPASKVFVGWTMRMNRSWAIWTIITTLLIMISTRMALSPSRSRPSTLKILPTISVRMKESSLGTLISWSRLPRTP